MHKIKIKKILIAILIIVAISVGGYFLLKNIDLRAFISSAGPLAWLIYILIRVLATVFLCFVPACSMIFDLLAVALFGANWTAFIICFISILCASFTMDAIGRFGGSKLIIKLVGQDDYEKSLNLIKTKGIAYIPVMYLLPVFPDDAICMVSGAMKVKWYIHYIEIALCRGIGCLTVIFGINLIPQELIDNFSWTYLTTHLFDYLTVVTVFAFWILLIIYVSKKIVSRFSK